jgi:hypothetical protein
MDDNEKLDLFEYLRPSQIEELRLRRAFLKDRERLRQFIERTDGLDWRTVSVRAGYKPDTLSAITSDAMVERQTRYNFKVLVKALQILDIKPTAPLDTYEV